MLAPNYRTNYVTRMPTTHKGKMSYRLYIAVNWKKVSFFVTANIVTAEYANACTFSAQASVLEIQSLAKQQICELQMQLERTEADNKSSLECCRLDMEQKLLQKDDVLKSDEEREIALQQRD